MTKDELREYIKEMNSLFLQIDGSKIRPFIEDIDFCEELLQEYKVPLSSFPSIELQRQLLLRHPKLLEYYDGYLELLFKDEDFARKIIESNNDILLDLNGYDIRSEYIRKFTIQLIKGEIKAKPGTELSKMEPAEIYYFSIPSVKNDTELAREFLKENISLFDSIENPEIKNDVNLMLQYLVKCPFNFPQYADKVKGHLTQEVTKAVIKFNFQNYKLIDENDPTMQLFYETLRRIKEVRPELKMDNPNLRYELLADPEIANLDINVLNALLEYSTGAIDELIQIKERGNLKILTRYIEQYNQLYGNNLENILKAIESFHNVEELLLATDNFNGLAFDTKKIKTIIATKNKFGINSLSDLQKYNAIIRNYYKKQLDQARTKEEIREIYAEMLLNSSIKDFDAFMVEYGNNNLDYVRQYAKEKQVENPIGQEFRLRVDLLKKIKGIDDIDELREQFEFMPLEIEDIEEVKTRIAQMYSQTYHMEMIDLSDPSLLRENIDGIQVIKLTGQPFFIDMHRVYNFDFSKTGVAQGIIEHAENWTAIEGNTTISTTGISDKKIAGIFGPMRTSEYIMEKIQPEEEQEYEKRVIQEKKDIFEGKKLSQIDRHALFFGFTSIECNGIVKMDSLDIMAEHEFRKINYRTTSCRMRGTEDLLYWTSPDYWNEILRRRKITDINQVEELRKQGKSDRVMPDCIICFDENINEESQKAARELGLPILMIDRQLYLDRNKERLEEARKSFAQTSSTESIKEIFYRQLYYRVVEQIPELIALIQDNKNISERERKSSLEFLAYLVQHFIEQSDPNGYILNRSIADLNEKTQQYIKTIDLMIQGKSKDELVTMDDMKGFYRETSALERYNRYRTMKLELQKKKENKISKGEGKGIMDE